ncbi:MAG: GTPase Era [Rothia sp. (in: high G+C Gram-positive bacteria)]|nr:GTPase Era [Rothia sp. (in: high G+C Gram-positive bacteria)]
MNSSPSLAKNFSAGFAVLVGRPNAGKSTLTNALVGQKVAITSNRPQTTRHTIRGIVHREKFQLIIVDTPGLHRPRTLLGERLNDLVAQTLAEVDVVGFCLPANEKIGPGDRYIAAQLAALGHKPIVAIVTKADTVPSAQLAQQLLNLEALGREVFKAERELRTNSLKGSQSQKLAHGWADIIPVSAVQDYQVEKLSQVFAGYLPASMPLYPDGELTDEPEATLVAELVREAALEGVHQELPHSLAATVEQMQFREGRDEKDPLLEVYINLFVERDSQKAIIIGRGGSRLKAIGSQARQSIERMLGTRVYLDIRVKVAKDWQRDPRALGRLGF